MNIFVPVPTEKFWWNYPVSGEVKIRTVHLIVECSNFVPIDMAYTVNYVERYHSWLVMDAIKTYFFPYVLIMLVFSMYRRL